MINHSMNSFRRTLICFLATLVLIATRVVAADSPELAEARAQLVDAYQRGHRESDNDVKQLREKITALEFIANAKASAASESAPKLLNVDFPGGPMTALLAAINKDGGGFNVVGEKSDLAIELPALSLRNADAASLANALGGLLQQRGYFLGGSGRNLPGQNPVFVLRKLALHEIDQRNVGEFQSFQLAPYLDLQSVDDIVSAIRAAWELDPSNKPEQLRIKFHPSTGILLVSGPRMGIHTVQTVLGQLRRAPDQNQKPNQKSAQPVAEKR
jgi:hypothetical protein